jgi:predicted O-methyltransferase YrrM
MMQEWRKLKAMNPQAKLVCVDIQPTMTTQAKNDADVSERRRVLGPGVRRGGELRLKRR